MAADIPIHWKPFWRSGVYAFSTSGAILVILNVALPLGVIGWLLIGASQTEAFFPAHQMWRWRGYFVGLLLILSIAAFFWLPRTEIVVG